MGRSKHETIPRQFRFQAETLAQLDALCERSGGITRSDMLRLLVTKAYHAEFGRHASLPDPAPVRPGPKPSLTARSASKKKR
jgi:hypothetical protein